MQFVNTVYGTRQGEQVRDMEGSCPTAADRVEPQDGEKQNACSRVDFSTRVTWVVLLCLIGGLVIALIVVSVTSSQKGQSSGTHVDSQSSAISPCKTLGNKKVFPDIDYAFLGYNALKGYPMAHQRDPGFTLPIHKPDYSKDELNGDCRYIVPEGMTVIPDVSCVTSFHSTVMTSTYDLEKSLHVHASVGGGIFGISFSASMDYKTHSSEISTKEYVYIMTSARCNYYYVKINNRSPTFHPEFITFAKTLENAEEEDVIDFIESYGTHYPTEMVMGARFTYIYKTSTEKYESLKTQDLSVSAQASYSGFFTLRADFGVNTSQRQVAQNFTKNVETTTVTVGAPPPANGDTKEWASKVQDNPVPTSYVLRPIYNMFTKGNMERYGFDYKKVRQLIEGVLKNGTYCEYLLQQGEVASCKRHPPAMFTLKGNILKHTSQISAILDHEGCINACVQDDKCTTVVFKRTHKLNMGSVAREICLQAESNNTLVPSNNVDDGDTIIFPARLQELQTAVVIENATVVSAPNGSHNANKVNCHDKCLQDAHCDVYVFCELHELWCQNANCLLYAGSTVKKLVPSTVSSVTFI